MIYNSITELIGKTPLLRLCNIEKKFNTGSRIFAKLEFLNPTGSIKDRTAFSMISWALERGEINKETVIIEPTSGNTGIGLAAIGSSFGMRVILTMPDNMSQERIKILKALGGEVVLTDGEKGMTGAVEKAKELSNEIQNSFVPSQFENFDNPFVHFSTTGPEIYRDLDENVDIFVSAFGTGGTISGSSQYLKSQKSDIITIGVEPKGSPFVTKGTSGPHKIQGIGAGFIPDTLNVDLIDEIVTVSDEQAYSFAKDMAKHEGLLVGPSTGAALCVAVEKACDQKNKGKNIVLIAPDSGLRYLSTDMF